MNYDITQYSGVEIVVLCFVADKYEPDVTAIMEEINDWYETDVPRQNVYTWLERLHRKGLVAKRKIDGKRNCYMLTTAGAEVVRDHRKLVESRTERIV